jgi:polysaccharide pyruvyl transferase WcaK-like protein
MKVKILRYFNIGLHSYKVYEGNTFEEIANQADEESRMVLNKWEVMGIQYNDDEQMIVMHNILEELSRLASLHESESEREQIAFLGTKLGMFYTDKKAIEILGDYSVSVK